MIAHRHRSLSIAYRQRRKRILLLVSVLIIPVTLAAGFYLGHRAAYNGMRIDLEPYRELELELSAARDKLTAVRGNLQVQRTRQEVDRAALEMVRREMAVQKERTAGLEEGLRFYKSLMAPTEVANGMSLRSPELVADETPGRYAYRFVVQQKARKHELLEGSLSVEVFGFFDGERASYPLTELSGDLEDGALALRFRYFQAIEGELILPEGFQPKGMNVVASASTPRKAEVREQFSWRLQEKFTHVGK